MRMNRLRTCFADPEVEHRFRIDSLEEETRLATAIQATWILIFLAFARSDFILHRGGTLVALVIVRAAIIGSGLAAIGILWRSRRPSLRDASLVLMIALEVLGGLYINWTRPEELSPLFAANIVAILTCWALLPLPGRLQALTASMVTAGAIGTILLKSRPLHRVEVIRVTLEFVLASATGAAVSVLAQRSRRARWAAVLAAEESGRALLAAERDLAGFRLNEVQSQLIQAQRAGGMGSVAAALAHELGQPLTAVRNSVFAGKAYLDREPPGLPGIRAALDVAAAGVERASEIVRRHRDYLRRGKTRREPVSPSALEREARALVDHAAEQRGITLTSDVAADAPEVTGDAVQLVQVLVIALVNAMDAMESAAGPRRALLWARRGPGGLEMGVDDTGPGIAPGIVDRLFEPFFTTKDDGMGMGLSIARTIVEAHGGTISAGPAPGGGARVAWNVPVQTG